MIYLLGALALILLIALIWIYQRSQSILLQLTQTTARAEHTELALREATTQLSALQQERDEALRTQARLEAQLSAQQTQLQELRERKVALTEELQTSFRDVASQILRERTEDLDRRTQETLSPLREDLQRFGKQVSETYSNESRERFSLQNEIRRLVEQSQTISTETTNLTRALKGDSKVQGDWGEMVLERILERSGLRRGEEYFVQETLRDEAGQEVKTESGRGLRPDVIVRYPSKGAMIIDSKVSLTAYHRYLNAETEEERTMAIGDHMRSLKKHIEELSGKKYEEHVRGGANFVMLFIPNEPAYSLALSQEPELWEKAYAKNIVLINATNLIAALRMAQDIWQRERQERNVLEIVKRAGMLYDKFTTFAKTFLVLDTKIKDAREAFDKAREQLATDRGNLVYQIEKLRELGVKGKKNIPIALTAETDKEEQTEQ